jgi:hypothetical protein
MLFKKYIDPKPIASKFELNGSVSSSRSINVDQIEGGNLVDSVEENLSIRRHLNFEERHQQNKLMCVNHAPKLVERCRPFKG